MKKNLISIAVLFLISSSALAAEPEKVLSNVPSGVYVEGTLGLSYVGEGMPDSANPVRGKAITSPSLSSRGFGYNLNLGYQFTNNIGVEVGATSFASQQGDVALFGQLGLHQNGYSRDIASIDTKRSHMYDIAAKFSLPVSDKFDLFAKGGLSYLNRAGSYTTEDMGITKSKDFRDNGYGVLYGVGVDYNITQQIAWTTQATGATPFSFFGNQDGLETTTPSMFLVSTGLKYTFA